MADRSVNININYKVNSAEVEKYERQAKLADQATEKLRGSTQSFASQATAGFKATGTSITAMKTDLERLRTAIETTSKADTQRLQQLSAQYKALNAQIKEQNKLYLEQTKATKQTAGATKDLAHQFGEVYSAIRLVIAAGMAKELVSITLNAAKLSGTIDGVEQAFNRLPNATLLLADLRESTQGTVKDLELMQKALMAQNYRIPLENLGTLFEFATAKAQQTGQEVNHLVDYIVTGIGLRSIKRLDDLGFTANRVKEALGGVSLQAASMGEVMSAVTKLMQEDLEKTGGLATTAATKVGQIETAWHELNVTISEIGTSPKILNFYETLLEKAKATAEYVAGIVSGEGGSNRVARLQAKEQALANVQAFQQMHITEEILKNKQAALDVVQQEINTSLELIGRNNDIMKQLKERHTEILEADRHRTYAEDEELDRIIEQNKFYSFKNMTLKESIKILKEYLSSLQKVSEIEKPEGEPAPLVTDPVRFFDLGKKKPIIPMDSYTKEVAKQIQESIDRLKVADLPIIPVQAKPLILVSEWEKAFEENKQAITDSATSVLQNQVDSMVQKEIDGYSARIDAARAFYDEQVLLAGDHERTKQELRIKEDREIKKLERERGEREKKAILAGIVANTALAIMKIFAGEGTYVDKIIRAGIMGVEGLSQYAIANRARYYAKGEIDIKGPGTKTSDSIPAMLSRGESVMTADQTASSKNVLKAVRAKKLNDKVLRDLMSGKSGGSSTTVFDDSKILKKLDEVKNATPDLIQRGNLIYEQRKRGDNYIQTVRAKSMLR